MHTETLATDLKDQTILLPDARQLGALEEVVTRMGATVVRYRVSDLASGTRTVERWLAELIEGEYEAVEAAVDAAPRGPGGTA